VHSPITEFIFGDGLGVYAEGWDRRYNREKTRTFRLIISPDGAQAGDRLLLEITGAGATSDTAYLEVLMGGAYQPDLQLGMQGQSYVGDDIYSATGEGQSVTVQAGSKSTVDYLILMQNDGDFNDVFTLLETGYDTGWIARYYDSETGGTEITDAVRGGGWTSPQLTPGASEIIRVSVTPGGMPEGSTLDVLLTATSQGSATKKDAVRIITEKIASGVRVKVWRHGQQDGQ